MKSQLSILMIFSVFVLQIACGKNEGKPPATGKPVPVNVMAIRYESIPAGVEAPGTVQPRNRIALSSQINGFVREIRVRAGDSVKADQVLVALDARDAESQKAAAQAAIDEANAAASEARKAYQAAVDMQSAAKASAELANQTYTRYEKLFESRSVSPQEFDEVRMRRDAGAAELASREAMVAAAEDRIKQVESRISQAKAQAGRADVLMSWTQVKAPASGRVVERSVDAGAAIFPGTPLLVLESTANPQVLANIPTEHADLLSVGRIVRLKGTEIHDPLVGRISEIVPLSDPATHSVQFKVDLPPSFAMPSGQFIKVEVPAGNRNAIVVPQHAIRETGQLTGLFVVDSASRARFRLVKTEAYAAGRIEVLSGVEPGEKIVTNLSDQIFDGIPVEAR